MQNKQRYTPGDLIVKKYAYRNHITVYVVVKFVERLPFAGTVDTLYVYDFMTDSVIPIYDHNIIEVYRL